MTDSPGAILQKLEALANNQNRVEKHLIRMDSAHNDRLLIVEKAIGMLAVQDEKFATIKQEQKAQWRILDDNFKPGGTIDQIKMHQAHCPIDDFKKTETNIDEITKKLRGVEMFQATCPAQNSKGHMVAMWAAIVTISTMMAAIFNMVVHQAEELAKIVKTGFR